MICEFKIYVDVNDEYNDFFYQINDYNFCPNTDNMEEIYNDKKIKKDLIKTIEENKDNLEKYVNGNETIDCFVDFSEEDIFYLCLKYPEFKKCIINKEKK